MSEAALTVLPFNETNLAKAFSNHLTPESKVKNKMHYRYFFEYLGNSNHGLNAKTILIENKYISKSYLIDYSNYYSTCFHQYDRYCKRVHFFSKKFSKPQLNSIIKKGASSKSKIWDSYLGYIVVKPLPSLTIGATLLKTYSHTSSDKRYFPATKEYKVNLFGKELTINSLAFQEQDSVVGACASSALWSSFHKTSQLFQTTLPSPSDITKSAKNLFQNSGRIYPNGGLDHYQIGNAIESVGLVSELRNNQTFTSKSLAYLKSFIYAYNKMGLPVLMGISFPEGDHLITITGYKLENELSFPRANGTDIALKASTIKRLYAHDDQIGPFSKIGFNETGEIITSWPKNGGSSNEKKTAKIASIFIPIHNKIRLTFENIYSKVRLMDFYFLQRMPNIELYWDIYLDFSNQYKKEVYESNKFRLTDKLNLLAEPLPKYIWIARGYVGNECLLELLFDATQIATADFCIKINVLNDSLGSIITTDIRNQTIQSYFATELGKNFLKLLEISCK